MTVPLSQEGADYLEGRERQRREALARANAKRTETAKLKRAIKAGEVDATHLLYGYHPEHAETLSRLTMAELLMSVPRIGVLTMEEVCVEMGTSGKLKLSELGSQRRADLAGLINLIRKK